MFYSSFKYLSTKNAFSLQTTSANSPYTNPNTPLSPVHPTTQS